MDVRGDFRLPLVAVSEKFLLVVQQLLVRLCGELEVGALDDGIDWASFLQLQARFETASNRSEDLNSHLTESTVNTLGHVNIVASCTSAAVSTFFSLDGDGLSWADGLTKFARDAALLSAWVSSEGVFTSESGAERSLLERVVNGGRFLEDVGKGDGEAASQLGEENCLSCAVGDVFELHAFLFGVHVDPATMSSTEGRVFILVFRRQSGHRSELRCWSEDLFSCEKSKFSVRLTAFAGNSAMAALLV